MQNGRNRIAANGRTKAGRTTGRPKAPLPKAPIAFPAEVAVAAPPGQSTPKSFPAKSPKPRPARRKSPHPVKQRRPGRKKRAAARDAEHRRQTAMVVVAKAPKATGSHHHPETPEVICLADASQPETVAALPLPPQAEPLSSPPKRWHDTAPSPARAAASSLPSPPGLAPPAACSR